MNIAQRMSKKLEFVRRLGLCPSVLNLYVDRYSFGFLLGDIYAGIKMFCLLFPLAISLAFFCGGGPVQGVISCAIAAGVGAILGGSKYQISSIALPICILTFDILVKYQYKGLFYTALFTSLILILFGFLKISNVLKHISYAFISALIIFVALSIVINQLQHLLDIHTIHSSQGIFENFALLCDNMENVTKPALISATLFLIPIIALKLFYRGFFAFFAYLAVGCIVTWALNTGVIPDLLDVKTVAQEMISTQSALDTIFTMSSTAPSHTFLSNIVDYAFVIALIIACEACFCTSVSASLSGDNRLQTNVELISNGIANFVSVALGGLFVSPDIDLSVKNIKIKSKTVLPMIIISILCFGTIYFNDIIIKFIPMGCLSSILLIYAISEIMHKRIRQYFNIKSQETHIFWITLLLCVYFGFIPAAIIGFAISCVFFASRMVKIKDANVHTTRNHDTGAIEFISNKQGFSQSMNIPPKILNKIEVIQVTNILFLNIAKIVEEAFAAQGKFPEIVIIYFNNVPYLDNDAFDALKELVKNAKAHKATVMISGTNGILLDIIQQKARSEKFNDAFGYVVPNFKEAIRQTVKRLG